jgi:hypothetical protein
MCPRPVYAIQLMRYFSDKLAYQHNYLTSRHNYLTSRHNYFTSRHTIWQIDMIIWQVDIIIIMTTCQIISTCQIIMSTCHMIMLTCQTVMSICQMLCRLVRNTCYQLDGVNWVWTYFNDEFLNKWQVNKKIWQFNLIIWLLSDKSTKNLTCWNNYLTSGGRNMPPYFPVCQHIFSRRPTVPQLGNLVPMFPHMEKGLTVSVTGW